MWESCGIQYNVAPLFSFLVLYLVTSNSLNGQTNKSSQISLLIQTKWRIKYLIFRCNYQKSSWGSLQWIFTKWMLLWANLVTEFLWCNSCWKQSKEYCIWEIQMSLWLTCSSTEVVYLQQFVEAQFFQKAF